MRYLISLLLWVMMATILDAQVPMNWGGKAGMNISQHYGTKGDEGDYKVQTGLRLGAVGGLWLDFAASEVLSLGFEALYSMKGSHQTITIDHLEMNGVVEELAKPAQMKVKYHLDYFELPVLLKLKILDTDQLGLNLVTGSAMSLKLRGHHELDGTVWFPDDEGGFEALKIWEESALRNVNMFDFSFVYGGGLRVDRLPVCLEYRFTLGWDYLRLPTYQFFDRVELRNQTWSLLLSSEF